ncbi:hypothetical protein SB717_27330 [Priestia sp. SIMBA_032]|uniref:hypothetical protein n=1 Tax=Priestia sp. SIMBA_032 TaxID=3085775 RepID=UPI00397C920D
MTGIRVSRTNKVLNSQVTPINQVEDIINKNINLIAVIFDEYTCVQTIRKMKLITNVLEKSNFPYILVNAVEGLDPLTGHCPTCEFTNRYEIDVTPSIIYLEKGEKTSELKQGPDVLSIEELNNFLTKIKLNTNYGVS